MLSFLILIKIKYSMKYIYLLLSCLIGITTFSQEEVGLIPFRKGNLYGYSDKDKNIVIQPQFDNAYPFGYVYGYSNYSFYALTQIDNTMCIVSQKGEVITEDEFKSKFSAEKYPPARQDRLKTMEYEVFEVDGKQGVRDELGEIIVPAEYDNIKIWMFNDEYYDEESREYFTPSFAQVNNEKTHKIIRLDRYTEYDNIRYTAFTNNSNHLVVNLTHPDGLSQKGVLTAEGLFLIDSKYINIWKYYENQKIMDVSRVIGRHPANMYISLDGIEYYED